MSLLSVGRDVPVSQMPAGMAFDSGVSGGVGGGIGQAILDGLGQGVTGALGDMFDGPSRGGYGSSGSRTPYTDRTRDLLSAYIRDAIDAFGPAQSTIG